jgi:hypothetical protein
MPAAIEKNAVAEEMSRMRGRGLEAHYSISRTSQGERNSPLQGWLDLKASFIAPAIGALSTCPLRWMVQLATPLLLGILAWLLLWETFSL